MINLVGTGFSVKNAPSAEDKETAAVTFSRQKRYRYHPPATHAAPRNADDSAINSMMAAPSPAKKRQKPQTVIR